MKTRPRIALYLTLTLSPGFVLQAWASSYTVDMGGPLDDFVIESGWYGREGPYDQYGGVWNSTCRWARQGAVVRVPVFPGVDNAVEMRAEVRGDEAQRLVCTIDGREIARVRVSSDLQYRIDLPKDIVGDREWIKLKLQTLKAFPVKGDSRDLRVAVDWIKISADAAGRDVWSDLLREHGMQFPHLGRNESPEQWRMRYDPNNVGGTYAPQKFHAATYDDSAWRVVPRSFVPQMRRGDAVWYRGWMLVEGDGQSVGERIDLPADELADSGNRIVWVNGRKVTAEPQQAPSERAAAAALSGGFNFIVVKAMKGPLPGVSGDEIVADRAYHCEWTEGGFDFAVKRLVLADEYADSSGLSLALIGPMGERVGNVSATVKELADGKKGVTPEHNWHIADYGEYELIIEDDAGHSQRLPLHFLGIHFFHWGWYSAGGGTTWRGFKPCSNDYLDQLFERIDDWEMPHHSISWGGAIIEPGTGFHRTEKVDYIARFREAFEEGWLSFVGMPYPPRNICTDFGESLLRSMRRSRELYRSQFGVDPHRFYSHDATMTPLLPQVMRLCAYDTYCIAENGWGQGRSIPNSRDCYFANADGTQVRVLDSWYHGISPVVAARRAVQQGKPAVLCNEEFACLDRTVFLEQAHLDKLAAEGIFVRPVTLDEYQQITEEFAEQVTYEGDEALCYKGWTGGGPGEVLMEQANRALETRLVYLETLVGFARWLGISVDQKPIDDMWQRSLRYHECHLHWGNGYPGHTATLHEDIKRADEIAQATCASIAERVSSAGDGTIVFNGHGFPVDALVKMEAPADARSIVSDGENLPLQPMPGSEDEKLASIRDLPPCGYRYYRFSTEPASAPMVRAIVDDDGVTMRNERIEVHVNFDGSISPISEMASGEVLASDLNAIRFAVPQDEAPSEPLSTERASLNDAHYVRLRSAGQPRVICEGPALAWVELPLSVPEYPQVDVTMRLSLVAHQRQVSVNVALDFPEPTVVAPKGARDPHEGTYFPGIYVGFPFPADAKPMTDMAYCVTDGVLTSTNHETFMRQPFRNGTFNGLSFAGPNSGEYAVMTIGLPDFFVLSRPQGRLGVSMGVGTQNARFDGKHTHEYAILVPAPERRSRIGSAAFRAARAFLVRPLSVMVGEHAGDLPPEGSFIRVDGEGVVVAGVQLENGRLRARVVNLTEGPRAARMSGFAPLSDVAVSPGGVVSGGVLELAARAVREIEAAASAD